MGARLSLTYYYCPRYCCSQHHQQLVCLSLSKSVPPLYNLIHGNPIQSVHNREPSITTAMCECTAIFDFSFETDFFSVFCRWQSVSRWFSLAARSGDLAFALLLLLVLLVLPATHKACSSFLSLIGFFLLFTPLNMYRESLTFADYSLGLDCSAAG